MAEVSFPTGPFYIQSKINLSNMALTADGTSLKVTQLVDSIEHLWTATPDTRGGAVLKHIQTGKVLTATPPQNEFTFIVGNLTMAPLDPTNALQLFRAYDVGKPWWAINLLTHDGVNITAAKGTIFESLYGEVFTYTWSDGNDTQTWNLIPETSSVTTENVEYDQKGATTNLDLPPTTTDYSDQDNSGGGANALTGTITLTISKTTSRSITNSTSDTTGTSFSQTFGVKGGIDKVFEVSVSASFTESDSKTISFSDQNTDSNTVETGTNVNINVPPGKVYRYSILVFNGECSIPYTAQMLFQSSVPGVAPYRFVSTGIYKGVNAIRSKVSVSDITQGSGKAAILETRPIPLEPGK